MKKWIAMILTLTLVLSMAACSTQEATPSTETKVPDATVPTIVIPVVTLPANTGNYQESQAEAVITYMLDTLLAEYDALVAGVDDYTSYIAKKSEIEAFYQKILSTSAQLCIQACSLAADYAEQILASSKTIDEKYEDMDDIYDLFYDDIGDEIYDGIYDGILDDIYDDLYDGALDDQPDDVKYKDWSDTRSKEYKMWSNTRSDTYGHWSDYRSDVYGFWSDMRSKLWRDDLDGAYEELEDFREDIARMASKLARKETTAETTGSTATGIRAEFKEAMDNYEKFFDEYVAFVKAYKASENPLSMMSEYTAMMQQYVDTMGKLQSVDQSQLSDEEVSYYAEVVLRINQKLLEAV